MRSTDDGASWMQVTPLSSTGTVSSISARGNLVVFGDHYDGTLGVSTDGGNTFTAPWTGNRATTDVEIVGSAILAATASGIYRSVDGGATFSAVPGIMSGALSAGLHCDGVNTCYASAYNAATNYPALLKSVQVRTGFRWG